MFQDISVDEYLLKLFNQGPRRNDYYSNHHIPVCLTLIWYHFGVDERVFIFLQPFPKSPSVKRFSRGKVGRPVSQQQQHPVSRHTFSSGNQRQSQRDHYRRVNGVKTGTKSDTESDTKSDRHVSA